MVSNNADASQSETPPPGWFPIGEFDKPVRCHVRLDEDGKEKWEKAANPGLYPLYQQGFMDGAEAMMALADGWLSEGAAVDLREHARQAGYIS